MRNVTETEIEIEIMPVALYMYIHQMSYAFDKQTNSTKRRATMGNFSISELTKSKIRNIKFVLEEIKVLKTFSHNGRNLFEFP